MRPIRILIALMAVLFITGFYCTKVEYNNPLDNKGATYAGDSATLDDDNDGTVNFYDPDWAPNQVLKKSYPKIVFGGPDTVIIAKDDPRKVLAGLTVTATDSIWGPLTDSIKTTGSVFTSVCSTFTLTYSVTNPMKYESHRSRTIIVDCAPPEIVLKGDNPIRLAMGTPYVEPGADATDNIDGNLTGKIVISGTVNSSREGIDTITYTVPDKAGNVGVQKRTVVVYKVVVKDTLKPILTLKGANPLTLFVNGVYIEPGYVAVDLPNLDTITSSVVVSGLPVITSAAATATVTYTVADAANNITVQTRVINIKAIDTGADVTAPVITFKTCSVCTTKVGQAWVDPGFTAWDDRDGDVTSKVVAPAAPNTNVPGTTQMRYTVMDAAKNSATYIRTVTVVGVNTDTTKPVIRLEGAVQCTVSVGKAFTEPGYTAQDNVDLIITDKVSRTVKNSAGAVKEFLTFYNTIDKYTITYTVSDAAGNAAIPLTRSVMVKDTFVDTTTNGDLLKKYGVPLSQGLPSLSHTYTAISVDGKGPSVATITDFQIAWRNEQYNKGLDNFSLHVVSASSTYLNLMDKITQTFDQPQPGFTLKGSGITGLDGDYYIKGTATECDWVKKDGSYAIVFK